MMKTLYESLLKKTNKTDTSSSKLGKIEHAVEEFNEKMNWRPGTYNYVEVEFPTPDTVAFSCPGADRMYPSLFEQAIDLGFKKFINKQSRTGNLEVELWRLNNATQKDGYSFTNYTNIISDSFSISNFNIINSNTGSYNQNLTIRNAEGISNTKISTNETLKLVDPKLSNVKNNDYDCREFEMCGAGDEIKKVIQQAIKDINAGKIVDPVGLIGGSVSSKCTYISIKLTSKSNTLKVLKEIIFTKKERNFIPFYNIKVHDIGDWRVCAIISRKDAIKI